MKKTISLLGSIFIVTVLTITSSFANNQVSDAQIYQLMDKSGVTRAIDGFPMQMQAMGQQMALTAKDSAEHQKFMKTFISSVNTEEMNQAIYSSIKQNVASEDMIKMLAWLEGELAAKIVAAELQSTEPEFQQNLMHFIADLQTTPPSQERTQTIIHYVESSKVAEQGLDMVIAIVKNMFEAIKVGKPDDKELATQLDAQLAQMKATMGPAFEQQMVLTSYYIYRDISDADLNQYSNFYQQEIGKKYLSALMEAIGDAMGQWSSSLVKLIEAETENNS
jgi:hypothetical protein